MTRRPFLGESAALFGGLSILLIVIGVIALVKKKVLAYVWFVPAVFVTVLQVLLWFFSRIGMHNVLSKDILLENQIIYIVNSVLIVAGLVFMGLWMKKKAK